MAFDGVRRRLMAFGGDFGLEDLFQERFESEEEGVDDEESKEEDADGEMCCLEPLLFDEEMMAAMVAENVERMKREAEERMREAEEKKRAAEEEKRKDEELAWRREKHKAVIRSIRKYDPKAKALVWTRFPFENFSAFDLDEESAIPPMRHTGIKYQTECIMYWSANVLSVKIVSSDVGFPVNVYGSVIARDNLDRKCIYLFRCHRRDSQVIQSEDQSLILIGPTRGFVLQDFIFLEVDLKIKGERGQDKQLSMGLLQIDGRVVTRQTIEVRSVSCASWLSTVEVKYAAVKKAVEATVEFQVLQGHFYGQITAHTTSISHRIVLHDSHAGCAVTSDGNGTIQLWRRVIAVCLNEMLIFTIVTGAGKDATAVSTKIIEFAPSLNGADEDEIFCGDVRLRVHVTWSLINCWKS